MLTKIYFVVKPLKKGLNRSGETLNSGNFQKILMPDYMLFVFVHFMFVNCDIYAQ